MSGNAEPHLAAPSAARDAAHDDIDVDGERVHVAHSAGQGTPLLICNNFAANLEVLDDFVAALERPVVRFDLPGTGTSAQARHMRRMPALARFVLTLLDRLELGSEIDVMGIGWGGLLAQQIARDGGSRVRRLVLAASSAGQLMFPGRLASLWRAAHPAGLAQSAPDGPHARAVFGGRRNDECEDIARAMARAISPTRRGYAAQLYALAGYSTLPWLHRLQVPTLVMAGDDDPVVPMVNARVLALLMPQAQLAVIRGGGHWFVLERSVEVARRLDEFLALRSVDTPATADNTL